MHQDPVKQDRLAYSALAVTTLLYVALRASLVPWVHDECASIHWYMERGQWLPYRALWDAGNHFASSAIGALGHAIWGLSLPGSRAGSVLAFVPFAWAVYRLGLFITDRRIRWPFWLALLPCPFLLDFFALFRGYGPAVAFVCIALVAAVHYVRHRRLRHLVLLLAASAVANSFMPALVPLWVLAVGATGVDLVQRARSGAITRTARAAWLLLGLLPVLAGLLLAWEMRRRGLLYHGSTDGYIAVTVTSLCRYVVGSAHPGVVALVVALFLGATAIALHSRQWSTPLSLLVLLLWADVGMRVGMALVMGVNHLEDRTALHQVVLFITAVGLAADALPRVLAPVRLMVAAVLLFLPIRAVRTSNLDHTLLWPEQSVPTRFLAHIADLQRRSTRPLIIGAYHQLELAIPYAARLHGLDLNPPEVDAFPAGPHDVRIVDQRFLPQALHGWRQVDHAAGPGLYLLEPRRPLELPVQQRTTFSAPASGASETVVWRGSGQDKDREAMIQLRARIRSQEPFVDLRLVVEVVQGGRVVHRRVRFLSLARPRWSGEELNLMVRVPAFPLSTERRVLLTHTGDPSLTIDRGEVTLHYTDAHATR